MPLRRRYWVEALSAATSSASRLRRVPQGLSYHPGIQPELRRRLAAL